MNSELLSKYLLSDSDRSSLNTALQTQSGPYAKPGDTGRHKRQLLLQEECSLVAHIFKQTARTSVFQGVYHASYPQAVGDSLGL